MFNEGINGKNLNTKIQNTFLNNQMEILELKNIFILRISGIKISLDEVN